MKSDKVWDQICSENQHELSVHSEKESVNSSLKELKLSPLNLHAVPQHSRESQKTQVKAGTQKHLSKHLTTYLEMQEHI